MIKRKDEMKTRILSNAFGGKGDLAFLDILEKEESLGMTRIFSLLTLKEGQSIGPHTHKGEVEIYYILKGEVEALDQGEWIKMYPGDVAFTRNEVEHGVRNPNAEDAELLAVIIEEGRCLTS